MKASEILMLLKIAKDAVEILQQNQIDVSLEGVETAIEKEETRHADLMAKLKAL